MTRFALLTGLGLLAGLAQAQVPASDAAFEAEARVHRLEIRDGTVYHDGTALPEGALPAELDVEGMSMTFEYSGPVAPAIGLNGRLYTLEGDRLVELDEAEMDRQAFAFAKPQPLSRASAEQAYMQGLSERDRALYERLVREREMETEAFLLAQQIRQNPRDALYPALQNQLRDKLDAMFELKQENRREEYAAGNFSVTSVDANGALGVDNVFRQETNSDFLLQATVPTTGAFSLSVDVGGNRRDSQYRSNGVYIRNLAIPGVYSYANYTEPPISTDYREKRAVNSLYAQARGAYGDYLFVDQEGEEDYADIETMLMWDVRPAGVPDEAE